ncbi:MAG: DUF2723 domain-containing protein [Acidobacteria bacterium]|nr:DUF2723 domain-containing protein [Acidobacteriota bacterium]
MMEKPKADQLATTHNNNPPMQQSGSFTTARQFLAAGVFLLAFLLYAFTLAPTVTLVDSGELILAAKTLGIAHPPGFPLYVLLAHFATLLPIGNLALRVHLLSALCAALASMLMMLLVSETLLTQSSLQTKAKRRKDKLRKRGKSAPNNLADAVNQSFPPLWMLAPAVISGLLLAVSRTLWAYATIAEVYTLNAMLILAVIYLMMRWRRQIRTAHTLPQAPNDKALYLAAFFFGLALGVHHVTVGLLLPALAALVWASAGLRFFTSKRLLYAALSAFSGLSIYLYLPFAASRSPLMNWGDPDNLERFWWHITGRQYQVFFDFSLARISEFAALSIREFGFPWLPLGLALATVGFVYLFKHDKAMFFFLALMVAADLLYGLGYEIDEDKDAYYLPAFIALTIAAGSGAQWFMRFLPTPKFRQLFTPWRAAMIFLLLPLLTLAGNFRYNNRSRYFIAHDYVTNILQGLEPNALLLTSDWQVYSPMLYVRQLEGQRPDVVAIDVNQLRRSWYFDYLRQVYPEVIEQSRKAVEAYLEDLKSWEQNPEAYANNPKLSERINTRFYDMIFSFINTRSKVAPVYATQEIVINRGGPNMELTTFLNEKFTLIPKGLLFCASTTNAVAPTNDVALNTRGLADGTLKFADDDVVIKKVLPVYLSMLTNRGRFLAAQNHHAQAIEAFHQALALDASYTPARNLLNASLESLQNPNTGK